MIHLEASKIRKSHPLVVFFYIQPLDSNCTNPANPKGKMTTIKLTIGPWEESSSMTVGWNAATAIERLMGRMRARQTSAWASSARHSAGAQGSAITSGRNNKRQGVLTVGGQEEGESSRGADQTEWGRGGEGGMQEVQAKDVAAVVVVRWGEAAAYLETWG